MIQIPYGTGHLLWQGPCRLLVSRVDQLPAGQDGQALVDRAMANPISTPPLSRLAEGKRTCTVILSDHTRPVPSRQILPRMLEQLRQGNPRIQITLLVATGFHRPTTRAELAAKLGEELLRRECVVVHNAFDPSANTAIGTLPSGTPLVIDRLAAETDLLVAEGFIEPHFFAGFSGGRKSVLPGVSDAATVLGNHRGAFIASPQARTGILEGNPIHRDMAAAAKLARLAYIVNVVINDRKEIVAAFAGHPVQAHLAGTDFLRQLCEVKADPADIVVTSNGGAPLDQNIYQCVKGLTAAEAAAKPDGVLILCAELADGTGGDGFYTALRDCATPAALFAQCARTPWDKTLPDQWESQILARILMKHTVIVVSRPEMQRTLEEMKLLFAPSLQEAAAIARRRKGADASVAVIPNGVSVIVT